MLTKYGAVVSDSGYNQGTYQQLLAKETTELEKLIETVNTEKQNYKD